MIECSSIFDSTRLLGEYPNTYAYTKSVVEQLVYDYSDKLPTGVARPPIGKFS